MHGNRIWEVGMEATRRLATLILMVLCAGCAFTSQATRRLDNRVTMQSVLLQNIPPGTPLDDARKFMELQGFKCKLVQQGSFVEQKQFGDDSKRHENIDYLECIRSETTGMMRSRQWKIAVVIADGLVDDVFVSLHLGGPNG
jgi:hypothetical protein